MNSASMGLVWLALAILSAQLICGGLGLLFDIWDVRRAAEEAEQSRAQAGDGTA